MIFHSEIGEHVTNTAYLKEHYARLTTEELLRFKLGELEEEAREVLHAELDARSRDPGEAEHFRQTAGSPFKTDVRQAGDPPLPKGPPFAWVEEWPAHEHHMGERKRSTLMADLRSLRASCFELQLELPQSFILFMSSPQLWAKFRSMNDGFFDLGRPPIKCPTTDGYLIPFISDQQYCHFYFLHLTPGRQKYEVVWADDAYTDALYAAPEVFARDYERDFDVSDIHLCSDDFEAFIWNHCNSHEEWLASPQFLVAK